MCENNLDPKLADRIFTMMCEIRTFELVASERYRDGDLPGFIHLSLGQEACAAGACAALQPEDLITSTHRGHGHCLAKGADPGRMMAELFAKEQGYSKGRAGSMHIADVAAGVLGANGIVGQSLGLGVGAALSLQIREKPNVVIAFFGEGASGTGIAHEAMNMAAIWKLPIVFFCEANRYAELSPYEVHVSTPTVAERSASYGFPGVTVNGENAIEVYNAVKKAVDRARSGEGPSLVEARTFRWHGHYEGDPQVYKTERERSDGHRFDPIARMKSDAGAGAAQHFANLEKAADDRIRAAAHWASGLQSPSPSVLLEDVYAETQHG